MAFSLGEVGASLRRGWPVLVAAGVIGGGGGVIGFSPLTSLLEHLGVHATLAPLISGAIIGPTLLAVTALVGAGIWPGRRQSLQFYVDQEGTSLVFAEYRGLREKALPLRLGVPPSNDPDVCVEAIFAKATHGMSVQFEADNANGAKVSRLPSQFKGVWSGEAHFDGPHDGKFDFVLVYRLKHNCSHDLATHKAKWSTNDPNDDIELAATSAWDEIEIRVYWERPPKLGGDPKVVLERPGKEPTKKRLHASSPGVWCAYQRRVKPGQKLTMSWPLDD